MSYYANTTSDITYYGSTNKGCSKYLTYTGISMGKNENDYKNLWGLIYGDILDILVIRMSDDEHTQKKLEWAENMRKFEPFDFFINTMQFRPEIMFRHQNPKIIYNDVRYEQSNVCQYNHEYSKEDEPINCKPIDGEHHIRSKPCTQCELLRHKGELPLNFDGTQVVCGTNIYEIPNSVQRQVLPPDYDDEYINNQINPPKEGGSSRESLILRYKIHKQKFEISYKT
jgi:hypothetical protein